MITFHALKKSTALRLGKNEAEEDFLKRITHLKLQGSERKKFKWISGLEKCVQVKVVYLYDNEIEAIENLENNGCLTHLYLQNNKITMIKGLDFATQLRKLHLDGNAINGIEGLSNCTVLEELHLSNQSRDSKVDFSLEQKSILTLSRCLRVLRLKNAGLDDDNFSMGLLSQLFRVELVDLSENGFSNLENVISLVQHMSSLKELDLRQTPVLAKPKSIEKVIIYSQRTLEILNDKPIDARQRMMMQKHTAHKHQLRNQGQNSNQSAESSSRTAILPKKDRKHVNDTALHCKSLNFQK